MVPNWDEQKESPDEAACWLFIIQSRLLLLHNRQKELPPAVPELIAFVAAGTTMNDTVPVSPALGCGSPRLWRE